MKFICFENKNIDTNKIGILTKDESFILELNSMNLSKKFDDMNDVIKNIKEEDIIKIKSILLNNNNDKVIKYKKDECKIIVPIEKPVHDILCVGVNYKAHLDETQEHFAKIDIIEEKPVYFSKRVTKAIGPDDDINGHFDINDKLDYEVELAVIIGKSGTNIPSDKVEDYIFGYTVLNDISARGLQKDHVQWFRGKGLDTFTSIGPCIVHKSEMKLPAHANIRSRVNGELRQNSNTSMFINNINKLVSDISIGLTLEPGDIIATGTPDGVGLGFTPPRFMKSGDVVECEVEGIGILKNYIK